MADWEFLTFSEKEPHKYRTHATLVFGVISLLYGLRLIFPLYVLGYDGISYAFRDNYLPHHILERLLSYHTPIIQGILIIILSIDILRTRNISPRHIKWATVFFVLTGLKQLSKFLIVLDDFDIYFIRSILEYQRGELLLYYSLILVPIAFSYLATMSILLERKGYVKRIYLVLTAYFSLSCLNAINLLLTRPLISFLMAEWTMELVASFLVVVYFFRGYRRIGILKGEVENIHWTLRGAIFLFGAEGMVRLGYNLLFNYEGVVEHMSLFSAYGYWLILVFLVGSSICVGSLLPWKIVYRDEVIST